MSGPNDKAANDPGGAGAVPSAVPDDRALAVLARNLGSQLLAAGQTVATAESCTGGWIAKVLTDAAGSSGWFGWGFVTYSNAAKQALVGVPAETLEAHGAVSEAVVRVMAAGALAETGADHAVAVSGIAGPDGGSADKPVGTVWFAWATRGEEGPRVRAIVRRFEGDREAVRRQSVAFALRGVLEP